MPQDPLRDHFRNIDLDLRKSRNGRFMDQKLTPDNLSFIADCILNHVGSDVKKKFTTRDIWNSDYFTKNLVAIYNKPDPKTQAPNEYDKFIGQPMRLLANANILVDELRGNTYQYTVGSMELLTYISLSQLNALRFLDAYLTKLLTDSGQINHFNAFESKSQDGSIDNTDLVELRNKYAMFIRGNTGINTDIEINRIFYKVLNILAVSRHMRGSRKGHLTEYPFIFKDLEYNTINWRDLKKRKDLTRKQAVELKKVEVRSERVGEYEMTKAKRAVKARHYPTSEVHDSLANTEATQVHHIFPDSLFPEYRALPENLILLTASQHNNRAHPANNTRAIDPEYQRSCLLSKLESIETSMSQGDGFYSLKSFVKILNEAKELNISTETLGVDDVRRALSQYT